MEKYKSKVLENSIENIRNNKDILESNKQDILRFFEHARSSVKESRLLFYAIKLSKIGKYTTKPFMETTRYDVAEIINKIQKQGYAESTFEQFKKTLKLFYRYIYGLSSNDQLPDSVRWIKTKTIYNQLQAEDLLTPEEVELLIKATDDIQIKAMIATLYETGVRIAECTNMRFRDIRIQPDGIFITVDGKTGKRTVGIVENYNLFKNWYENHPFKMKESYFFSSTKQNRYGTPFSCQYLNRLWKLLAKKQNIQKKVYNHLFRHTRATILYRDNPTMAKKILGHSLDSKMERIYVHLADSSVEDYLLASNGKKIEERKTTKVCVRCNTSLSLTEKICHHCGLPRDGIVAAELQENSTVLNKDNIEDYVKLLVPKIMEAMAKS